MVSPVHEFGGSWTEDKLNRLGKYLPAYTRIFTSNDRAKWLTTTYVDAFAGTGSWAKPSEQNMDTLALFGQDDQQDIQRLYKGSAQLALEVEPPFDHYLFIERNPAYVNELSTLREMFPSLSERIEIREGEANRILREWCSQTNWNNNRAVVFLDPYGLSVEWDTLHTIAATKAIDLWILLPVGSAINRMLPRRGIPNDSWSNCLTRVFGTDSWIDEFYAVESQLTLPGLVDDDEERRVKSANFDKIGQYFIRRLKTEFAGVSNTYRVLLNSRRNPIFMLFFAAGNKRGAATAIRIADYILSSS